MSKTKKRQLLVFIETKTVSMTDIHIHIHPQTQVNRNKIWYHEKGKLVSAITRTQQRRYLPLKNPKYIMSSSLFGNSYDIIFLIQTI